MHSLEQDCLAAAMLLTIAGVPSSDMPPCMNAVIDGYLDDLGCQLDALEAEGFISPLLNEYIERKAA